ncbi:lipoyltransferase and lipoate-protein ligase [Solidesulfovibrio fructosivorans JJ]]|uniref:lipoate--protein ligase n=1 Tax=Solidesulfovibrio fructosivorans JJ] TaxID=596151 RepID=E1K1K9_SOLFR|nr:lipoate--protein ligase [Solidesulfovibrio fructosivorans]EFL49503.1 lipoyltransferase and lipoate-protein ligase [Solidesulfovibrio fructosivorans JJ]]
MRSLHLETTDPAVNLATEEWLLRHDTADVFMLWRNRPSIIIGRNQNAHAQINAAFVAAQGIPVVRRLTGGGAVFHDLGNVNFTFITTGRTTTALDFKRFTDPIVAALQKLGVPCRLDGRNDLTVHGRKISGNAQFALGNRVLHHGTLLYAASMPDIARALVVNPAKYKDKAVKSVTARVANIRSFLRVPLSVEDFIQFVFHEIDAGGSKGDNRLTPDAQRGIALLADRKYRSYDWNFGCSPRYAFSKSIRTGGGVVEIHFDVKEGLITELKLYGEYFFKEDGAVLETRIRGCRHTREAIANRLRDVHLEDYMVGVGVDAFVDCFF